MARMIKRTVYRKTNNGTGGGRRPNQNASTRTLASAGGPLSWIPVVGAVENAIETGQKVGNWIKENPEQTKQIADNVGKVAGTMADLTGTSMLWKTSPIYAGYKAVKGIQDTFDKAVEKEVEKRMGDQPQVQTHTTGVESVGQVSPNASQNSPYGLNTVNQQGTNPWAIWGDSIYNRDDSGLTALQRGARDLGMTDYTGTEDQNMAIVNAWRVDRGLPPIEGYANPRQSGGGKRVLSKLGKNKSREELLVLAEELLQELKGLKTENTRTPRRTAKKPAQPAQKKVSKAPAKKVAKSGGAKATYSKLLPTYSKTNARSAKKKSIR